MTELTITQGDKKKSLEITKKIERNQDVINQFFLHNVRITKARILPILVIMNPIPF